MKIFALLCTLSLTPLAYATSVDLASVQKYQQLAEQKQLYKQTAWQRLLYANAQGQSEVRYDGFFLSPHGKSDLKQEINANIAALFEPAAVNQSIQCRFPARSQWLIQQLEISKAALAHADCAELDEWMGQIKPYKATLIYATDFMGNPSSMFGHTLLRLDPKDQKQLNLVSYALNYAATVQGSEGWSYAWKGLTGQYDGEYSLMPYYRKVKEYGDFESRDLWEYELSLSPEETLFLVQHIWEMKHVKFPYYFISDNCAYRLLGLLDIVRPELNLQQQDQIASIPIETLKTVQDNHLIQDVQYRPALETQLLAQARQHGQQLAKTAHQLTLLKVDDMPAILAKFDAADQAKILEMAYDDLYLVFISRKIAAQEAQPKLRQILSLRSQLNIEKQRTEVTRPRHDPVQGHHAKNTSIHVGDVQGQQFVELGLRQAYHDLLDPQGGYRTGTQLNFWDGALQYRDDELKLEHFDFLSVNSYNPITPFKRPLTWGFNLGWQQEAIHQGQFNSDQQHGVLQLKTQFGYSVTDQDRQHVCYAQLQPQVQAGKSLDDGWRIGLGPAMGCQNIWTDRFNSLIQLELPYWQDANQWNLRLNTGLNYAVDAQNSLRITWQYQQQNHVDWNKTSLGFVHYF
ncbi:DUF4105 domain-containing protein [Acinetobacter sp. R933-2]|uniref:Lnb N-terminal periplasmic domain-containing protein n=1 Tax=Acinetobacter sp. R933-2 TaxID=2746728 RepID=UPI0025768472|nr:DUF4105 domain-containing protein [Acinetobacter sp. R933-2]MDM1246715.1 DUF4105 domain-containing protein [Acinetobacter sp. R933-2]